MFYSIPLHMDPLYWDVTEILWIASSVTSWDTITGKCLFLFSKHMFYSPGSRQPGTVIVIMKKSLNFVVQYGITGIEITLIMHFFLSYDACI